MIERVRSTPEAEVRRARRERVRHFKEVKIQARRERREQRRSEQDLQRMVEPLSDSELQAELERLAVEIKRMEQQLSPLYQHSKVLQEERKRRMGAFLRTLSDEEIERNCELLEDEHISHYPRYDLDDAQKERFYMLQTERTRRRRNATIAKRKHREGMRDVTPIPKQIGNKDA
jgi:hypothetical protein